MSSLFSEKFTDRTYLLILSRRISPAGVPICVRKGRIKRTHGRKKNKSPKSENKY
nr:MAG TPA: hypothetical protein [Caudoviricetes sp.]